MGSRNLRTALRQLCSYTPLQWDIAVWCMYTVSHKKRATLFLIITPPFLCRFLYFLYRWNQEGILYKGVNKIYHFTLTLSPHYQVKLKRHINSRFWSQSSQCVQSNRLFATLAESHPMFIFPILCRKFFNQYSVRKTFTFPHVLIKNFRLIFKLNVFHSEK